ncbi:MAG: HAD-IA family hydrolase [Ignavibacteriae bacterium]|nr:HAD-IA family hydrolase [Ignavibacteriota bacterium]
MQSNGFSCVIFDLDGTLTQTNPLIFASFNHITEKYLGKTFTPREIISWFGPPEEGAIEHLLGADRVDEVMDELCEFYQARHSELARLHAGIPEILRHLQEREIRLAVFTGKGSRTADITLKEFNIGSYFELVVSGNDVVHHKPHPEGIQKILGHFALDPSHVLMIGDSLADIKASRAAGVKVAAVLWDSYDKERMLAAGADFVFHNVGELQDWFRHSMN